MALTHQEIYNELFPGLAAVCGSYSDIKEKWAAHVFNEATGLFVPEAPHIWIPKLTLPEAVAVGAAAAIVKNPIVTRRFWQGWAS